MQRFIIWTTPMLVLALASTSSAKCPPDSVLVGPTCVDAYEASAWIIPPSEGKLIKKVRRGKATAEDLERGGAELVGCELVVDAVGNWPPGFSSAGNWTPVAGAKTPTAGVYAASVAGVQPTTCASWFQAAQACALSGKRLLRNDEWQMAAAGTPDPGTADDRSTTCNTTRPTSADGLVPTGGRSACVSNWGAFDMIGNAGEWVADWGDLVDACGLNHWQDGDLSCVGTPLLPMPGAIVRGGSYLGEDTAGVFSIRRDFQPWFHDAVTGFRCGR